MEDDLRAEVGRKMNSALEGAAEHPGDRLPIGSLIRNLSALLAMGYRRAPLPISADMVRWFAGRSGPEAVLELGSVVRRNLGSPRTQETRRRTRRNCDRPVERQQEKPWFGG
jgi:hypothetical protein